MFEDWEDFYINDCLYDLSAKSFLEQISFESLLTCKQLQGRYHFHVLIRDYLESSKDNYNISKPLEIFRKNYFKWLNSDSGEAWLVKDLGQDDIDEILQILSKNDAFSQDLSSSLSRVHSNQNLMNAIADTLISHCKRPGHSFPSNNISTTIYAYNTLFEGLICRANSSLQDCMDKLILCQPKIEELHTMAKGDYEAMEASSFFHDNFDRWKCLKMKNSRCVHSYLEVPIAWFSPHACGGEGCMSGILQGHNA